MGTVLFIGSKTSTYQALHRLLAVYVCPLLNFYRKELRDVAVEIEAVYGSLSPTR